MSSLLQVPGLHDLVRKNGLEVFVETGCDEGEGLQIARDLGLNPRYSCDLNAISVAICSQWGFVACMKSTDFLRQLKGHIRNKPTLFWLDAHFPGTWGINTTRDCFFPLLDELQVLATVGGIDRCVVICDDMCNIQSEDNPTRNTAAPPSCAVEGITMAELTSVLPLNPTLHHIDTGILVLSPR